jgi:cell division protein FtsN
VKPEPEPEPEPPPPPGEPEPVTPTPKEPPAEAIPDTAEPEPVPPSAEEPEPAVDSAKKETPATVDLFAGWRQHRKQERWRPRVLTIALVIASLAAIVWLLDSFGKLPFSIFGRSPSTVEFEESVQPARTEPVVTERTEEPDQGAVFVPPDTTLSEIDTPLQEESETGETPAPIAPPTDRPADEVDTGPPGGDVPPAAEVIPEARERTETEPREVAAKRAEETLDEIAEAIDDVAGNWSDSFVVHVSSFRRPEDADAEAAELKRAGLTARVVSVILPDRGRWERVVVGAFADSQEAGRVARRLRAEGLVSFAQVLGQGGVGDARLIEVR